jgi:hypothetical protein
VLVREQTCTTFLRTPVLAATGRFPWTGHTVLRMMEPPVADGSDRLSALLPLELLHLRRGSFIEECAQLDNSLGFALHVYYEIPKPRYHHFLGLITGIGPQQKINALARILPDQPVMKRIVQGIRVVFETRNLIAHGTLGPDWEEGDLENTLTWHHSVMRRSGQKRDLVEAVDLAEAEEVARLYGTCMLLIADQTADKGVDALVEIDVEALVKERISAEGVITVSSAFIAKMPERE